MTTFDISNLVLYSFLAYIYFFVSIISFCASSVSRLNVAYCHQIVRGEIDASKNVKQCQRGTRIRNGATIRLQHLGTGHWLHSHGHRSPLSSNQEVSAYGNADESNTNDNWRVETNGEEFWERNKKARAPSPPTWSQEAPCGVLHWGRDADAGLRSRAQVRLVHADTGVFLWSHNKAFPRPIRRGEPCFRIAVPHPAATLAPLN